MRRQRCATHRKLRSNSAEHSNCSNGESKLVNQVSAEDWIDPEQRGDRAEKSHDERNRKRHTGQPLRASRSTRNTTPPGIARSTNLNQRSDSKRSEQPNTVDE
jgi:hypothetical protein